MTSGGVRWCRIAGTPHTLDRDLDRISKDVTFPGKKRTLTTEALNGTVTKDAALIYADINCAASKWDPNTGFDGVVEIPYCFQAGIDDERKAAARAAVAKIGTDGLSDCIVFREESCDATKKQIIWGVYDTGSCYASCGSYQSQINMGWCKTMAHLGSLIHEVRCLTHAVAYRDAPSLHCKQAHTTACAAPPSFASQRRACCSSSSAPRSDTRSGWATSTSVPIATSTSPSTRTRSPPAGRGSTTSTRRWVWRSRTTTTASCTTPAAWRLRSQPAHPQSVAVQEASTTTTWNRCEKLHARERAAGAHGRWRGTGEADMWAREG